MAYKFNAAGIITQVYAASRHIGGEMDPTLIILHDTAGRLTKGNSADWLRNNPGKASAHFVVERDGSFSQLVPVDKVANHAGKSSYHGRSGCNNFSVGIEIVNPGKMEPVEGGTMAQAWWGQIFDPDGGMGLQRVATPMHGDGFWMPYTEEQIETVQMLCTMLMDRFPKIADIRAHWYVSPGRKFDTNPLFPMEYLRGRLLGRDDPEPEPDTDGGREMNLGIVKTTGGDSLNLRRWPSFNPNVIRTIPAGATVEILKSGAFSGVPWLNVRYGGTEGWVVARYVEGRQ